MGSKKNTLKIVSATSMVLFSLFACFSGCWAWFTAQRSQNSDANDFAVSKIDNGIASIGVYEYYGTTLDGSAYGFKPTADHSIAWSGQTGTDTTGFEMGKFSLGDPHHPVLFLMRLNGSFANVVLKTDYPYLAKAKPSDSAAEYATYSSLASTSGKASGYYQVANDENQNAYYVEDATNKKVTTQYYYDASEDEYTLSWIDLGQQQNPLSSIIESHYVLFSTDPTSSTTTGDLTTGGVTTSRTYFPIAKSLVEANRSTFVTFDASGNPIFGKRSTLFDGDVSGYAYLGIFLDYNAEALEHIYSYFLGHPFLNEGLGFKCDFNMEV